MRCVSSKAPPLGELALRSNDGEGLILSTQMEQINENDHGEAVVDHDGHQIVDGGDERTGGHSGVDVDLVIESMRGHNLARILEEGSALPNTGIPGNIGGFTKERVIHAPTEGFIKNIHQIGDVVEAGTEIARIYENMDESGNFSGASVAVPATITGIIRGLIREGYHFPKGFKIADIDPREGELKNCFTISDKARSIGGSVLEAVCHHVNTCS